MTDSSANAHTLLQLLRADDLDAAIEAGLMEWPAHEDDDLDPAASALLRAACTRLRVAWAARERFRARQARLQRRAAERQARRVAAAPVSSAPPLPTAAAAVLARARSRAGIQAR